MTLNAQHGNSLYLMHNVPESNMLNPAVRTPCKWYIGMPILSSTHINYSNNVFSYNEIIDAQGQADVDKLVNQSHWRNYFGIELHTQFLAIGYNHPKISMVFSINEKSNIPVTLPKDALELVWNGNTQFEGETASLHGTGLYLNHYREYAFSVSKELNGGGYWGVRAKLLFGKLNVSTRSTDIEVTTNENTFDLDFDGDLLIHSSLPLIAEAEDNVLTRFEYDESVGIQDILLNSNNPGFAIDLGVIYPYSDKLELSVSLLDLGFIRWRSNLNTFTGSGAFTYEGALTSTIPTDDYLNDLLDELMESFEFEVAPKEYTTFLPSIVMAGANYRISSSLQAGLIGRMQFYRSKTIPSLTLQTQYSPFNSLQIMASYSLQYYDYKQIGLGLVFGRSPIQFYAITDNLVGMIWPLTTQSVNLRFGFNIILGCKQKKGNSDKSIFKPCMSGHSNYKKPYMKNLKRGYTDRHN